MAFDFKKEYKSLYLPKARPEIVQVPQMHYVAVRGQGDPNEPDGAYQQAIGVLYAVAYTLKMSYKTDHKIDGFFEYVVPPLEGFWLRSGADKPVEQLLNTDFKEFHIAGHNLGICQITCLDTDRMLERLPEILPEMQKIKDNKGYDMFLMMLTDVLRCGTELVFLGGDDAVRQAFNLNEDTSSHHVWLPKVVSRKKQIVPALALLWG